MRGFCNGGKTKLPPFSVGGRNLTHLEEHGTWKMCLRNQTPCFQIDILKQSNLSKNFIFIVSQRYNFFLAWFAQQLYNKN